MKIKECSAIMPNQLIVSKLMAEQLYYKVCHQALNLLVVTPFSDT